jgi:uncharacterized repeat protein (TIGR03803 family)
VIQDTAGNLYGTTSAGGATTNTCNPFNGCGVLFKLSPAGTESVLYSFTGGADGAAPAGGLVRDPAGNLYGTATLGGSTSELCRFGCGTVFTLSPSGTETVLYRFAGYPGDGANPGGDLIRDAAGNLYGTTLAGGYGCNIGCGTAFELSPTGVETVLHRFTGGVDGYQPRAGLIRDGAGNLYGTAPYGGAHGNGVVFELIRCSSGYDFKVLYSFTGGVDGGYPFGGLIRDGAGNLYGTTFYGGAFGAGAVFKLSPAGTGTVLHSFTRGADGEAPFAGLMQDTAGNLYGTTSGGGATSTGDPPGGCGVVFRVAP